MKKFERIKVRESLKKTGKRKSKSLENKKTKMDDSSDKSNEEDQKGGKKGVQKMNNI